MQEQHIKTHGLQIGQQERTEELNRRLFDRIVPSSVLRPNFDPRPAATKRTKLPVVDERVPHKSKSYLDYSPEAVFYGGNSKAPVEGFLANISKENDLRNQIRPLQRSDPLSTYIPDSSSDLYNTMVPTRPDTQPHPLLFNRFQYASAPQFVPQIGNDTFHNHSRTQLRNLE